MGNEGKDRLWIIKQLDLLSRLMKYNLANDKVWNKLAAGDEVWNDFVLPLDSARVPAANAPAWTSFVGNLNAYTYGLNDYQEFTTELLHGYKEGSTFEFHVHGALNGLDGTERTLKYEIEYSIANANYDTGFGDVFPAPTTVNGELTIPAGTADLTNYYLDISDVVGTGFEIGATIKGRVRRIASTGTEPAGDPFLTQVGVHAEMDSLGSLKESIKV